MGDVQYVRTISKHYKQRDQVVSHIVSLTERQPGLFPEQQAYTYDDGRVELLVRCYGIIPVSLRGTVYNCPVAIWLPIDFPSRPPLVYVTPVPGMIVRTGPNVDPNGVVSISYLSDWHRKNGEGFSLVTLAESLQYTFSKEYPLVSVASRSASAASSSSSRPPKPAPPPPFPSSSSSIAQPPRPPHSYATASPPPPRPSSSGATVSPRPPQQPPPPMPPPIPGSHHVPNGSPSPPVPYYAQSPPVAAPRPPQPPSFQAAAMTATSGPPAVHQLAVSSPTPPIPPPAPPAFSGPPAPPASYYQAAQSQHLPRPTNVPPGPDQEQPGSSRRRQERIDTTNTAQFQQKRERRRSVTFAEVNDEFSPVSPPDNNRTQTSYAATDDSFHPITARQDARRSQPVQPYRPIQQSSAEAPPSRSSRSSRSSRYAKHPAAVNILDGPDDVSQTSSSNGVPTTSPSPSFATRARAAPPVPVNPAVLAARARLHSKLSQSLASLRQYTEHEISQLSLLESDLSKGIPAIEDEMQRLRAVKAVCETVRDRYAAVVREGENRLREYETKGDGPEVDEIVCSSTIVYNQLLELMAEDAALEDTIYHLGRSLNSDTAKLDLEQFLKRVRTLSREQFLKRALINKILLALETRRNRSTVPNTNGA